MSDEKKRRPPAYQVYAADDIGSWKYSSLSAGERGVLDSMHRSCWIDDRIPREAALLARIVRLPKEDIDEYLTPRVLSFFEEDPSCPGALRSPELTRQMQNIRAIREKQSAGGTRGAQETNRRRRGADNYLDQSGSGLPTGRPAAPERNGEESRGNESNSSLRIDRPSDDVDPWLSDYDAAEHAVAT